MNGGAYTIDDINRHSDRKEEMLYKTYNKILKMCYNRIKFEHEVRKKKSCYFTIPKFVFGSPTYNPKQVAVYIMIKLDKDKYKTDYRPTKDVLPKGIHVSVPRVYIDWSHSNQIKRDKLRKKRLEKEKERKKAQKKDRYGNIVPKNKEIVNKQKRMTQILRDLKEAAKKYE